MTTGREALFLSPLWAALGGAAEALDAVAFEGAAGGLPSVYPVGESAAAQVAAATLAVAELDAARSGGSLRSVRIDRRHVAAAFRSERYQRGVGWEIAPPWDPIAGDYEARDGWIRLHTNYGSHRDAALRVLGVAADWRAVAAAVRARSAEELETAVAEAGGCAAAMRSRSAWDGHAQGAAVAREPLVSFVRSPAPALSLRTAGASGRPPLDGVRVLDLTRVIAGPVCSRFLAAYGADVLRIDPPGFEEVPALLGDTTGGKRRAALDLRAPADRAVFERRVAEAHVLLTGYRSDALARLGYAVADLRARNPGLVVVSLDAYGWTGPWRARRGFDSLVQMACGIAARGAEAAAAAGVEGAAEATGSVRPVPLPAQALDHGTGYLLAAAASRALCHAMAHGQVSEVRLSLARTARWLMDLGEGGDR